MITGFNSDIEHDGQVFHVQTEEKGLDNPVVITLVYSGGEIVTSFEASYSDLIDDDPTPEGEVRRRMSDQHQRLIREILRGRFTPPQMPYGHELISDRSLDELVLGYLEEEIAERTVKVGRVLNKLGRFLSAAEQARVELEAPEEPVEAEVEKVDHVEIEPETDVATPEVDAQVAVPTPERRRRKMGWIWAAAAVIVGVAGVYVIRSLGPDAPTPGFPPPRPAPTVESSQAVSDEGVVQQASASVVADAPSQASEPIVEAEPAEGTQSGPAETAPVAPRVPAVVSSPVATPEPEPTLVEDLPSTTPEPSTTIQAEPIVPQLLDEPIVPPVEDEPIVPPDEVDVSPTARQRDLPRYTRRARRLQQEGVVELRVQIDSQGNVTEVDLLSGIPNSDLNEAALEATRDWTFSPAHNNGRRVAVWKDVAFEFTVRPDRTTSVRIRE
jgi:TonB family protein